MTSVSRRRVNTAVTVGLCLAMGAAAGLGSMFAGAVPAESSAPNSPARESANEPSKETGTAPHQHRSGPPQVGKASFYADEHSGRTMADGTPMLPTSNNAASRTLPLGSTARVTNIATGKSAIITIRDRGPYVKGRIVDLSPATATQIGMNKRQGLALVSVTPITRPQPLQRQ